MQSGFIGTMKEAINGVKEAVTPRPKDNKNSGLNIGDFEKKLSKDSEMPRMRLDESNLNDTVRIGALGDDETRRVESHSQRSYIASYDYLVPRGSKVDVETRELYDKVCETIEETEKVLADWSHKIQDYQKAPNPPEYRIDQHEGDFPVIDEIRDDAIREDANRSKDPSTRADIKRRDEANKLKREAYLKKLQAIALYDKEKEQKINQMSRELNESPAKISLRPLQDLKLILDQALKTDRVRAADISALPTELREKALAILHKGIISDKPSFLLKVGTLNIGTSDCRVLCLWSLANRETVYLWSDTTPINQSFVNYTASDGY